jgi:hypothetical protein
MELGRIDAERLVFVDEMGTHTSLWLPCMPTRPWAGEPSSRSLGTAG